MRQVILIIGTRPEAIKLLPVYAALKEKNIPVKLCCTMQHGELLTQVLDLFGVTPDYNLNIMRAGQDLFYMTQAVLQKTKDIFLREKPSLVIVQGDTTSAMAAALSAFYAGIPVAHVEAGLRTDDLYAPFPEEMNRRVISSLAQYHFAPTESAVANLQQAGIQKQHVFCVGNTVVDALRIMQEKTTKKHVDVSDALKKIVLRARAHNKKLCLFTIHRRESFQGGIEQIMRTVHDFLVKHTDVYCYYPFHPNPQVVQAIDGAGLNQLPNCFLSEPISYADMVYLLQQVDFVITDSGGLQEEAVSLGKPVIVLRKETERMEGVHVGLADLVGTDGTNIAAALHAMINRFKKEAGTGKVCPKKVYGDGYASEKIVAHLQSHISGVKYKRGSRQNTYVAHDYSNDTIKCTEKKKDMPVKKVAVVGLGYIGLPTSLVMAEHDCKVVGVDSDAERVACINAGDPVIYEPEVYEKLQVALQSGDFLAQTTVASADYSIIAVPTPCKTEPDGTKKSDLSCVFSAAHSLIPVLRKGTTIILESTVPVGTTKKLADLFEQETGLKVGRDFFVAHCPERVLPGKIFHELIENDRIIGGITQACAQKARELYALFVRGNLYTTSAEAAEMVKLVENSSRDVQIAFANQVGAMAQTAGLNPYEIIELANKHPRVNILQPSCGVGGHCIALDPWFLIETFPRQTQLLQTARTINDEKPHQVIASVFAAVDQWQRTYPNRTCTVGIFGLTYKADVDDLRESPALAIAHHLVRDGRLSLVLCEPHVKKTSLPFSLREYCMSVDACCERADVALFLVPHTRFSGIDKKRLQHKIVLDVCGLFYEGRKEHGKQEPLYWPARSMMDFFIVHQEQHSALSKDDTKKEDHV